MAKEIKTKSSFGTVSVNHLSPAAEDGRPPSTSSEPEQALKLQLGLSTPSWNSTSSTVPPPPAAQRVNLCLFTINQLYQPRPDAFWPTVATPRVAADCRARAPTMLAAQAAAWPIVEKCRSRFPWRSQHGESA
jgi:hypothetical protein